MTQSACSGKKDLSKRELKYVDSDRDLGFGDQSLEKIKQLLLKTDPEKWRIGGQELTPESRFPRPRAAYEQVLVRDIANGSLVLHCVQPVSSQYLPGGYALTALGPPSYTVEIRDRIFDADKIVDPRFADNQKGKRCDVVASGDVAKSLFIQVKESIRLHNREKKGTFQELAQELVENMLERIEQTSAEEWEKIKEFNKDEDLVRYITELDGMIVEVSRKIKNWESEYALSICSGNLRYEKASANLARSCFKRSEELEQKAQLYALSRVIEDLEFE